MEHTEEQIIEQYKAKQKQWNKTYREKHPEKITRIFAAQAK
jgi:hypothetical protein